MYVIWFGREMFESYSVSYLPSVTGTTITTSTTQAPSMIPGVSPTLRPPTFQQITPTARPPLFSGEVPTARPYCDIPLGVGNMGMVSNNQLSASTSFNFSYEATNARLDGPSAWVPR